MFNQNEIFKPSWNFTLNDTSLAEPQLYSFEYLNKMDLEYITLFHPPDVYENRFQKPEVFLIHFSLNLIFGWQVKWLKAGFCINFTLPLSYLWYKYFETSNLNLIV